MAIEDERAELVKALIGELRAWLRLPAIEQAAAVPALQARFKRDLADLRGMALKFGTTGPGTPSQREVATRVGLHETRIGKAIKYSEDRAAARARERKKKEDS